MLKLKKCYLSSFSTAVRLVAYSWQPPSLPQSESDKVQANSAGALSTLLDDQENLALTLRTLMGGLPILLRLLASPCREVQCNACGCIGILAKHPDILAVMTEQGVLSKVGRCCSGTFCRGTVVCVRLLQWCWCSGTCCRVVPGAVLQWKCSVCFVLQPL